MKNTFKGSWLVTSVFVLVAGLTGCASNSGEKTGAYVDDTWITSKVKSKLIADGSVKARNIDVDVERGVVTLSGTAGSWEESNEAAAIARGVKGVQAVENEIKVQQ